MSFVFAALPPIARDLGLTELQVSLIYAPAAPVFVLANGVWGLLIDRIGRKVVIVATASATLVAAAFGLIVVARLEGLLSATLTFLLLAGSRILNGVLTGGFLPGAQAYVADITAPEPRTRGLAIVGAGFALGMVAGPGVAALFVGAGRATPFYAVATLAALATAIVLVGLPESRGTAATAAATSKTGFRKLGSLLAVVVLIYTSY